jgi:hypothetical protein
MKSGDLVRQAPNIFADREIGGKPMLVVQTWGSGHVRIDVLFNGQIKTYHEGELELYKPRK